MSQRRVFQRRLGDGDQGRTVDWVGRLGWATTGVSAGRHAGEMDRLTVLKRANEGSFSVLKLVADWHPEALAGFWTAWLAGAAGWWGGGNY